MQTYKLSAKCGQILLPFRPLIVASAGAADPGHPADSSSLWDPLLALLILSLRTLHNCGPSFWRMSLFLSYFVWPNRVDRRSMYGGSYPVINQTDSRDSDFFLWKLDNCNDFVWHPWGISDWDTPPGGGLVTKLDIAARGIGNRVIW